MDLKQAIESLCRELEEAAWVEAINLEFGLDDKLELICFDKASCKISLTLKRRKNDA